jgi:hypothetical protein
MAEKREFWHFVTTFLDHFVITLMLLQNTVKWKYSFLDFEKCFYLHFFRTKSWGIQTNKTSFKTISICVTLLKKVVFFCFWIVKDHLKATFLWSKNECTPDVFTARNNYLVFIYKLNYRKFY